MEPKAATAVAHRPPRGVKGLIFCCRPTPSLRLSGVNSPRKSRDASLWIQVGVAGERAAPSYLRWPHAAASGLLILPLRELFKFTDNWV